MSGGTNEQQYVTPQAPTAKRKRPTPGTPAGSAAAGSVPLPPGARRRLNTVLENPNTPTRTPLVTDPRALNAVRKDLDQQMRAVQGGEPVDVTDDEGGEETQILGGETQNMPGAEGERPPRQPSQLTQEAGVPMGVEDEEDEEDEETEVEEPIGKEAEYAIKLITDIINRRVADTSNDYSAVYKLRSLIEKNEELEDSISTYTKYAIQELFETPLYRNTEGGGDVDNVDGSPDEAIKFKKNMALIYFSNGTNRPKIDNINFGDMNPYVYLDPCDINDIYQNKNQEEGMILMSQSLLGNGSDEINMKLTVNPFCGHKQLYKLPTDYGEIKSIVGDTDRDIINIYTALGETFNDITIVSGTYDETYKDAYKAAAAVAVLRNWTGLELTAADGFQGSIPVGGANLGQDEFIPAQFSNWAPPVDEPEQVDFGSNADENNADGGSIYSRDISELSGGTTVLRQFNQMGEESRPSSDRLGGDTGSSDTSVMGSESTRSKAGGGGGGGATSTFTPLKGMKE